MKNNQLKKRSKKMTRTNLDLRSVLCCDLYRIGSNIKKGFSSDASVFKEKKI